MRRVRRRNNPHRRVLVDSTRPELKDSIQQLSSSTTYFTFHCFVTTKGLADKGAAIFQMKFGQGRGLFGTVVRRRGQATNRRSTATTRQGLCLKPSRSAGIRYAAQHRAHILWMEVARRRT
eukprot:scaffold9364_cov216-Amphora_coffeaeformis.AAC.3